MVATMERPPTRPPTRTKLCRVTDYARRVVAGEIVTGELVRLACQRHLDDLEHAEARGWRWNQDEAERILAIFPHMRQFKGRWAREPLQLLPWQEFVVGCTFGWQQWDGNLSRWVRRFRVVYVSVGRKNGKSTLCGGVAIVLLDFDDEPGAEVYAVATKRDQAKQVWDVAQQIVAQSPALAARIEHLASTSRLIVRETNSKLAPLGRDSDTEHGLNPSGALIDELHVHPNRGMVDAIETAIGARAQPLIEYITTAGIEGASIYTEMDDLARRVVRGIVDDPRMFVYLACPDDGDDWKDPAVYVKGNPSLGHTVQLDELIAERDKAVSTPGRQNSFKRLRLNMRTAEETSWMDLTAWDACAVKKLERQGRQHVGVDLGATRDLSAAAVVTMDADAGLDLDVHFWMPEEKIDEAEKRDGVPYRAWIEAGYITAIVGEDDERIADDIAELGVSTEVDMDPWQARQLERHLASRGLEVVRVYQTFNELGPATAALEEAVAKRKLSHLGNPVLRWMIANCAVEERRDGARKVDKQQAFKHKRHIDGAAATLTALARMLRAKPPAQTWTWGSV